MTSATPDTVIFPAIEPQSITKQYNLVPAKRKVERPGVEPVRHKSNALTTTLSRHSDVKHMKLLFIYCLWSEMRDISNKELHDENVCAKFGTYCRWNMRD